MPTSSSSATHCVERPTALERRDGYWCGRFRAMGGPCELLAETADAAEARRLLDLTAAEAWRIERKFSRYRDDNPIHEINNAAGRPIEVDAETAQLLDFARRCHELSGGLFDVTAGVLRRAWRFDGGDRLPAPERITALLPLVGWTKLRWEPPRLTLPAGMEIDLGGVAKEYAVDRTLRLLAARSAAPLLVNFGGDIAARGPRRGGAPWIVGIEGLADGAAPERLLELEAGALATSGDTRRFLIKDGRRYGHILDPQSGWPVADAPRCVTVAGATCTEAGMLATFAMLHGAQAESFLAAQGVQFWCQR